MLRGDPLFSPIEPTGEVADLGEVRLLSPVIPRSKVVCVGKNYAAHAREMGSEVPEEPVIFLKPNTAVIGPDDPIVLPKWSQEVHHEVELAVVMKNLCKDITADQAADYILGYTIANDVTARDIQRKDGQWTRSKSFDSSCPLGPWIVVDPELNVQNLRIQARVDGEIKQDSRTSHMERTAAELVAFVSQVFTLLPGDVILTGTPEGVGPILPGQRVECDIEGIGYLSNPVVRR